MKCRAKLWIIILYSMGYQFCGFVGVRSSENEVTSNADQGGIKFSLPNPSFLQLEPFRWNKAEPARRVKSTYYRNNSEMYKSSYSSQQMPQHSALKNQNDSARSPSSFSLTPRNHKREILSAPSTKSMNFKSWNYTKLKKSNGNSINATMYKPVKFFTELISKEVGVNEARTLVVTTVGIINAFIASTAAFGMGGVVLSGFFVLIKLMLKAVLLLVGWIYII